MRLQANHFGISERIAELIINLEEMENAVNRGKNTVNLTDVDFVTPLSILPLAVYANHNNLKVICTQNENSDPCRYLETIGFQEGVTNLPSGKRYLPITKLRPVERDNVLGEYEDLILSQANMDNDLSFKTNLKYLTSELVNNVNEHAQIDHYWLFAQYYEYSKNKTCEIVLADCGIGYKNSYEGTEFEVGTDKEAIINAMEGKSSKSAKAKINARGKGIPSIANLFVNGYNGKLVIMSGKSLIYYKPNERKEIEIKSKWQGSLVGISFNLKSVNLYKYVDV
jgi:hypothetical protein